MVTNRPRTIAGHLTYFPSVLLVVYSPVRVTFESNFSKNVVNCFISLHRPRQKDKRLLLLQFRVL